MPWPWEDASQGLESTEFQYPAWRWAEAAERPIPAFSPMPAHAIQPVVAPATPPAQSGRLALQRLGLPHPAALIAPGSRPGPWQLLYLHHAREWYERSVD